MSWASIANNQCVSNANLDNAISTSVFVQKSSFSATNQELTKERAQQYVYLNENLASFLAKALNQLVVKQDLQAATIIGCGTGTYETIQWTANTLIITTAYFDVGTTSGTLTIDYTVVSGSASLRVIYGGTSSTITIIVNTSGSATYSYTYDAGVGTTIGITFDTRQNTAVTQNFSVRTSCAPAGYSFGGCGKGSSISAACNDAASNDRTFYSECSVLSSGCSLFNNSDLTNPVTELFTFADASWDMDGYGVIVAYSSTQC